MTTYAIRPGDTLYALARRFHTTVDALVRTNGIANPSLIVVGRKLTVPGSSDGVDRPRPAAPVANTGATTAASSRGIAANARVVVIGDSHTAGTFGTSLKTRLVSHLRSGGGKVVNFTGIPSAGVSNFLNGTNTQAGSTTYHTPRLDSLLAQRPRPTHLVVALGTNMLFGSKSANEAQIRALLAKADHAGVKVTWVGPPDVRGYGSSLAGPGPEARFYDALRAVNAERRAHGKAPMRIVDSRAYTQENQTLDGVHFGGSAARAWARGAYQDAIR
jgi:lysophospholipase L1-like esterase